MQARVWWWFTPEFMIASHKEDARRVKGLQCKEQRHHLQLMLAAIDPVPYGGGKGYKITTLIRIKMRGISSGQRCHGMHVRGSSSCNLTVEHVGDALDVTAVVRGETVVCEQQQQIAQLTVHVAKDLRNVGAFYKTFYKMWTQRGHLPWREPARARASVEPSQSVRPRCSKASVPLSRSAEGRRYGLGAYGTRAPRALRSTLTGR